MTTRQTLLEIWRYVRRVQVRAWITWYQFTLICWIMFKCCLFSTNHGLKPLVCNRDGGMKGLFMGVGPRVGRAGPSVGIVVSFYEVVKYALHYRKLTEWLNATHTFVDLARPWVDFGILVSLYTAILSDTLHLRSGEEITNYVIFFQSMKANTVKKGCRARNFWRIKDFRIRKETLKSDIAMLQCNCFLCCKTSSCWKSMSVLF